MFLPPLSLLFAMCLNGVFLVCVWVKPHQQDCGARKAVLNASKCSRDMVPKESALLKQLEVVM